MKPKLLITGASGFVGYHLVRTAKDMGFQVHAAIRHSSNVQDIAALVDQFVYPDFSDIQALTSLLAQEGYTYIIHAAALTKAKRTSDMFTVNVDYTINLLTAAFSLEQPPQQVHIVSSLAAIGPLSYNQASSIKEDTPYAPVTVYGKSKMKMEMLVKERFPGKPIRIFRPTAVYGPREKDIFILLKTLNTGVDTYIGRKPQALSFIYVKDLVDVLLNSLSLESESLSHYNVTDGLVYDRYCLADIFRKITGKRLWRFHVPLGLVAMVARIGEWSYRSSQKTAVIYPERLKELTAGSWACDTTKIKLDLQFKPQYDLEAGLTESLSWYREHRWL